MVCVLNANLRNVKSLRCVGTFARHCMLFFFFLRKNFNHLENAAVCFYSLFFIKHFNLFGPGLQLQLGHCRVTPHRGSFEGLVAPQVMFIGLADILIIAALVCQSEHCFLFPIPPTTAADSTPHENSQMCLKIEGILY